MNDAAGGARFAAENPDRFEAHRKALEEAADETAIRQVLKAALSDPGLFHAGYHELGRLARERIAALRAADKSPANRKVRKEST